MRNRSGFTLMELMTVIGIIAVLSAISVPILFNWQGRHQFGGTVRDVLLMFRQARVVAIEKNEVVAISVDPVAGTYVAFVDNGVGSADEDENGVPDEAGNGDRNAGERIVLEGTVPDTVHITAADFGGNAAFWFDNRGFPVDGNNLLTDGTVTLTSDVGGSRQIRLLRSGHSVIQ